MFTSTVQISKLVIDARLLFFAGIGTYLQGVLKRMPFESLGIEVHIYVADAQAAEWIKQFHPSVKTSICPAPVFSIAEQIFWKKNLDGKGLFWAASLNIPLTGYEKLAVTLHDCFGLTQYASLRQKLYAKYMFRQIRKKADVIVTSTEFSRHELHQRARIFDVPTYVVPLGVEPSWFTSQLPPRPYPFNYLLHVGPLKPHKNLGSLLKAYQMLSPQQKLVCVGPYKELRSKDRATYNRLRSLKDRVLLTDRVSDEQLRAIVKHSDGLVLPSLYEGFGLAALEAMASKVPVLVSQVAALPESCSDAALYCDPHTPAGIADGLNHLISLSGAERARRIAEGSEHAATFNWDKTAAATFEILRTTIS